MWDEHRGVSSVEITIVVAKGEVSELKYAQDVLWHGDGLSREESIDRGLEKSEAVVKFGSDQKSRELAESTSLNLDICDVHLSKADKKSHVGDRRCETKINVDKSQSSGVFFSSIGFFNPEFEFEGGYSSHLLVCLKNVYLAKLEDLDMDVDWETSAVVTRNTWQQGIHSRSRDVEGRSLRYSSSVNPKFDTAGLQDWTQKWVNWPSADESLVALSVSVQVCGHLWDGNGGFFLADKLVKEETFYGNLDVWIGDLERKRCLKVEDEAGNERER